MYQKGEKGCTCLNLQKKSFGGYFLASVSNSDLWQEAEVSKEILEKAGKGEGSKNQTVFVKKILTTCSHEDSIHPFIKISNYF